MKNKGFNYAHMEDNEEFLGVQLVADVDTCVLVVDINVQKDICVAHKEYLLAAEVHSDSVRYFMDTLSQH